jgi:hypothetical protein
MAGLDDLGIQFGTDKSSAGHDYLRFYEPYLAPLRDQPVRLLEIGILGGASLAVWEAYFANGTIIGADIDRRTLRFARPRVLIEIIDQSNIEHLTQLAIRHGPFDVIVEDGSHMWEHQITSLRTLFPFLKNGGFYVVEDLQTNYGLMEAEYRGVASLSCVEYLKKLVDLRVGDEQLDPAREEDAFLRTYGRAMGTVAFSRHACLIQKCYQDEVIAGAGEPLLHAEAGTASVPARLLAHLGHRGDVTAPCGWVRATRRGQAIQGFAISLADDAPRHLHYRSRSMAGIWSAWATGGTYVGTRGRKDNLTGFSVRLAPSGRAGCTLQAAGQFGASGNIVAIDAEGDCVSPNGRHPLTGMQVRVLSG